MRRLNQFKDLTGLSRMQVMTKLSTHFRNEKAFVGLVSQNLNHIKHPQLPGAYWTCNIEGIYNNLNNVFGYEIFGQYPGSDVQLILGGNSYKFDKNTFTTVFPNLKDENIVIVPGAGHWVQAERPEETTIAISDFLLYLDCVPKYEFSTVTYSK